MLKLYKSISGGGGDVSSFSETFNATTDWTLSGGNYYITFTHNLGTESVVIQLYDTSDKNITTATTEIVDANNVKITVPALGRFAGRIMIVGGTS